MKIHLTQNGAKAFIKTLSVVLDCAFTHNCKEYRIDLPEEYGNGYISAYDFDHGTSLIYFDCTFLEELDIIFTKDQVHAIHFNFCVEGEILHKICNDQIAYQLNPLNGSISSNPSNCTQSLAISPKQRTIHTNLQIQRSDYLKKVDCDLEKMHPKLQGVFRDVDSKNSFLHEINYNIPTAECIQHITGNGYEDLVRSSFAEAKSLELLALQLKQFADDLDPDTRFITLKKYDLDKILKAKEILVSDLQEAPTIPDLAKMSGINQQKLKRGFKQVFGKTVNQYLRDARLETAKYMIMDGKSSIQDVAERVGYSNRGHFARKFREKYGLLPKDALQTNPLKLENEKLRK